MHKKKIVVWIITVCMLLTTLPVSAMTMEDNIHLSAGASIVETPDEDSMVYESESELVDDGIDSAIPEQAEETAELGDSLEEEIDVPDEEYDLAENAIEEGETPDFEVGIEEPSEIPDDVEIEADEINAESGEAADFVQDAEAKEENEAQEEEEESLSLNAGSSDSKLSGEPDFSTAELIVPVDGEFLGEEITFDETNLSKVYMYTPDRDERMEWAPFTTDNGSTVLMDITVYDEDGVIIESLDYTHSRSELWLEAGTLYYFVLSLNSYHGSATIKTTPKISFGEPFYLTYVDGLRRMCVKPNELVSLTVGYNGLYENYAQYQWYYDDVPIEGETGRTFSFISEEYGLYECLVTNPRYPDIEQTLSFEIWIDNGLAASGKGGGIVAPGTEVTMSTRAVCDQGELYYSWEKQEADDDKSEELNEKGSSLTAVIDEDCIYVVSITDDYGNSEEISFSYKINEYIQGNQLVLEPQYYYCGNNDRSIILDTSLVSTEGNFLSYKWYKGEYGSGGQYLSETSSALTVTDIPYKSYVYPGYIEKKDYYCIISCNGEKIVEQFTIINDGGIGNGSLVVNEKQRAMINAYAVGRFGINTTEAGAYKISVSGPKTFSLMVLDENKKKIHEFVDHGIENMNNRTMVIELENSKTYYIRVENQTNGGCNFDYLVEYIDTPCPHQWDEGVVTKKPTSSLDGVLTYTCSLCGGIKTEPIPKLVQKPTPNPTTPKPTAKPTPKPTAKPTPTPAPKHVNDDNAFYSETDKAFSALKDKKDFASSSFVAISLVSKKQTKTSINISWNKVSGAAGYLVYGSKVGGSLVRLSDQTDTTFTYSDLKKGTYYKLAVVAYKSENGKKTLSSSKTIYVATKGGKAANVSKIKLKKKTFSLVLKKNKKTGKIKATEKISGTKLKNYMKLRYESSNPEVATVSKTGKITAKGVGKCTIYVYAQNGISAKVKVTVKKK